MNVESHTFRVALVGCGRIAQVHSGYLRGIPEAMPVGACDASPEAREAFARRWQLPAYAEVEEMLAAAEPHVVHVLTPPQTHAPLARQLLAAGVHVLVEKPMTLSVAEANEMIGAARQARKFLTVDHNRWFDPVVEQARHLLDSGALGTLVGVDVRQGVAVTAESGAEPAAGAGPRWHTSLPGGPLFDSLPHPVYLLQGFLGPVADLQVAARTDERGRISEVRALARGERALGVLSVSAEARPITNRVTLYGTALSAEADLNNMTLIVRRTRQVPKVVGKILPNIEEAAQLLRATVINGVRFVLGCQRYYPGMGNHLRRLYENLAGGGAPPVSAEQGRDVVALTQAICEGAGVTAPPTATATVRT